MERGPERLPLSNHVFPSDCESLASQAICVPLTLSEGTTNIAVAIIPVDLFQPLLSSS